MIDPQDFVAGALSLDFVNTVGGLRTGLHNDKLESYADLIDWAVLGGAVTGDQGNRLRLIARRRPEMSVNVLGDAKALREALHTMFCGEVKRRPPPKPTLDFVNQRLGQAMSHARIARGAECYAWTWEPPEMLDAPLWPVVHDAGELLASESRERLRECASETCGWFFLDLTKNRSRRWCAMSGCGNRAKVRRFRDRHL
ncbi:MAG TPA: ABATE domain-containing protein [Rhizomicrobium sp.]|jgi:predicted RNA-binding Zn ribbon-like protein|nr:ABATE domain-containing protein [Rhizomicrobium sp.]